MPDILVIDDHQVNLRLMQRQLETLGYTCDVTTDAANALDMWSAQNYRLIITDCHMPRLDGIEMVRRIRAMEAERGIANGVPVLSWTADVMEDNLRRCREAGMNGHLAKPTLLSALDATIKPWLEPSSARDGNDPSGAEPTPDQGGTSILDERAILEFTGGDPDVEQEILNQYLKVSARDFESLMNAINIKDAPVARMLSHRAKGACRIMGASGLGDAFEKIESAAKANDWSLLFSLVNVLHIERQRLHAQIAMRIERLSNTG